MLERPFLLDVTRLIARSWTGRSPTGIDRVCYAYLRHFGAQAQAVVQHRGVVLTLTGGQTDDLFGLLRGPDAQFRRRMLAFAPGVLARGARAFDGDGAFYFNVSHTDFDLASHARWTAARRLRPIYLLHDLIPLTHPALCRPHATARHRGRVIGALRTGAGIIVNSRATARELDRFARDRGLSTPPVLTAELAGADLRATSEALPDAEPYFLCVGTIEPRKNHAMLLRIWQRIAARMGARAPRLIVVGQWGAGSAAVREMLRASPALRPYVTVLSQCPDGEMARLMKGARALLMPTMAEGFGLPVVEALVAGTPVIASDLACFRETGQGVPTLIDPQAEHAWEDMIRAFAGHHPERDRQLATIHRYRPVSWADHFAGVENWLPTLRAARQDAPRASGPASVRTSELTA